MLKIENYLQNKEFSFLRAFLFYVISLIAFSATLLPFIDKLIIQKFPSETINDVPNLKVIVFLSFIAFFIFSIFLEAFLFFLLSSFLGSKIKFKYFTTIFLIANIPIAIKYFTIAAKNLFVANPTPYIFFSTENILIKVLDPFNLCYLILLFLLLKTKSEIKSNIVISVILICSFIYRCII